MPPRRLRALVILPPTRLALMVAGLALALGLSPDARAQAPLTLVNDDTRVSSIGFAFEDGQTLPEEDLRLQIALTEPPSGILVRLRGIFGNDPGVYPFNPVLLGKDIVRLTRYYVESGFPLAEVDYEVDLDTASNAVDVTFLIEEGPPLLIDAVEFAGPGQADVLPLLAPEIRDEWTEFTREISLRTGQRLDQVSLLRLQGQAAGWLRNRGYAYADAGAEAFVDETGLRADVRVKVNVGPRAVFGDITVVGADSSSLSLNDGVLLRELPFEPGDLFDASALAEGQREVFGLGLFQLAVVNVAPDQEYGAPEVDVVVRVRRGPSRVLNAFAGYFSDGGITLRGQATHRNAFGGARSLGLDVETRTGIFGADGQAIDGGPITDYRATVTFRQPYVVDRRLSYTLQPSVRDRNDEIESSRQAELANTLLFTRGPLQTAALSLTGRYRDLSRGQGLRLLDGGLFESPPDPILQSQELQATTGVLGLDVTWGRLDDALQPTRGFVFRPAASVAGGDVSYARARLGVTAIVPLRARIGLVARATAGAMAGLGETSPDNVDDYVLLRDQLFYGGGTGDVRGWSSARLGAKTLVITPPTSPDGTFDPAAITSPGDVNYVGIGGRARMSASIQFNLPFPIGPPELGSIAFLDGGRVWSPSDVPTADLLRATGDPADVALADVLGDENAFRFGAGAGLQYLTPVGFVSVAVGYKLNPSYLDVREAARVYCGDSIYGDEPVCAGPAETFGPDNAPGYLDARLRGVEFDPGLIEIQSLAGGLLSFLNPLLRRSQFHISIGQSF